MFQLLQKKLRTSDYSLLVDAIKARIYLWPRHALSYAGKIELISVWRTKHSLISWRMLCKPKEDGGLGLKNLGAWNKDLIAKTLWKIHLKKDSLTIKWISHVHSHFPKCVAMDMAQG